MKYNIPCEVVQDLLPSYVEDLTSPETNEYVKDHLAGCEACNEIYEAMKPQTEEAMEVPQIKEINYLKNVKKKNHRSVFAAVALCTILALGWIFGSPYMRGQEVKADQISYDYEISNQHIKLWAASTEAGYCIKEIKVKEVEPGVLEYSFANAKESPWSKQCVCSVYDASAPITQVRMDGIVIWNQDRVISRITSEVYNSRHPYIGDMPANGTTASALNVQHYLGNYTTQLETSQTPYIWTLTMQNTYSSLKQKKLEDRMRGYAYAMLAVIDNLDIVRFEYHVDNELCTLAITDVAASRFAGMDIKKIGEDPSLLEDLLEKCELTEEHYFTEGYESSRAADNTLVVNVINLTEEELGSISLACYRNGILVSNMSSMNANETKIASGIHTGIILMPEDFGISEFDERDELKVAISVTDEIPEIDYQSYDVKNRVKVIPETVENVVLKGSFEKGFFCE